MTERVRTDGDGPLNKAQDKTLTLLFLGADSETQSVFNFTLKPSFWRHATVICECVEFFCTGWTTRNCFVLLPHVENNRGNLLYTQFRHVMLSVEDACRNVG
jgi:hypothetical protein